MIRQVRPRAAAPEAWGQINAQYAADAELIAKAPDLLLCSKQLEEENRKLREMVHGLIELVDEAHVLIQQGRRYAKECDMLRKRLKRRDRKSNGYLNW